MPIKGRQKPYTRSGKNSSDAMPGANEVDEHWPRTTRMNRKIVRKFLSVILVTAVIFNLSGQGIGIVLAQSAPAAPVISAPTEPVITQPPEPVITQPPEPVITPEPTAAPQPTPTPVPAVASAPAQTSENPSDVSGTSVPADSSTSDTGTNPVSASDNTGVPGDSTIITGDTSFVAMAVTNANTNINGVSVPDSGPAVSLSGNGADSNSSTAVSAGSKTNTVQDNSAVVGNTIVADAITGTNDASKNVGDATIMTGDANVSGTLITSVNTNLAGVMVSEFNVVDNHTGDLVLDFAANCIANCPTDTSASVLGNGAGSENVSVVNYDTDNDTFQNNDAAIENTLVLEANSGDNTASMNTDGDSVIATGDANVSANALTFANNNIEGNVVYGVVNIYGDLVGDIIFPEEALGGCCSTYADSSITNNGAGSANTTKIDQNAADTVIQNNDAVISNDLALSANSGDNITAYNTGGDSAVVTGNTETAAQVVNIANNNLEGGNWWIILVNEAGKWVGKILGSPDSSNMAVSQGMEFSVDGNGNVLVAGNGADSTNGSNVTDSSQNTVTQENNLVLNNNLDLTANTGGNNASKNTGGNSGIVTGDAQIIANVVNFVNNNIAGGGKIFITVVNVFGSWIGDFVTPGQTRELVKNPPETQATGGTEVAVPEETEESEAFEYEYIYEAAADEETQPDPVYYPTSRVRRIRYATPTPVFESEIADTSVLAGATGIPEFEGFAATDGSILAYNLDNGTPLVNGKKVIRIDLGWLLAIIGCAILAAAIRKFLENRSVLTRHVQIAAS